MNETLQTYQEMLKVVKDPHIAALLTLADAIKVHAKATRAIAHGDIDGATGLEALATTIAGEGLGQPVADAVV